MHFLKKGQKIRAWVDPPPHLGNARKKTCFFSLRPSLRSKLSKKMFKSIDYINIIKELLQGNLSPQIARSFSSTGLLLFHGDHDADDNPS